MDMKKYLVEVGFGEGFLNVDEWQTIDGLDCVEAENAEEAAKAGAWTDSLENALFRVYELVENEFGELEKTGEAEYFNF